MASPRSRVTLVAASLLLALVAFAPLALTGCAAPIEAQDVPAAEGGSRQTPGMSSSSATSPGKGGEQGGDATSDAPDDSGESDEGADPGETGSDDGAGTSSGAGGTSSRRGASSSGSPASGSGSGSHSSGGNSGSGGGKGPVVIDGTKPEGDGGSSPSSGDVTQQDVDNAFTDEVTPAPSQEASKAEGENVTQSMVGAAPSAPVDVSTSAPGRLREENGRGSIDYSNTDQGYVMVASFSGTANRLKALVNGPTTQYQYDFRAGDWVALPLSDGNGHYRVSLYENVRGSSYAELISLDTQVSMPDAMAPFKRSNQYVNISAAPNTVATAAQLCSGSSGTLDKVGRIYDFIVKGFAYDEGKAATVQSGYLPDLDRTLAEKRGICFDYAAIMAGMLRSQGVPTRLVVGYAGSAYHAWIDVWTAEGGWVSGAVYFDGNSWKRMDPTFASSGGQSEAIMAYIGDGQNYSAKYFY